MLLAKRTVSWQMCRRARRRRPRWTIRDLNTSAVLREFKIRQTSSGRRTGCTRKGSSWRATAKRHSADAGTSTGRSAVRARLVKYSRDAECAESVQDRDCKDGVYEPEQFGLSEFLGAASITGHVVSGFSASIRSIGNGQVVVKATNTWGRESMSRWPRKGNRRNPSVQELGTALRHMAYGGSVPSLYLRSTLYDIAGREFDTARLKYVSLEGLPCAP